MGQAFASGSFPPMSCPSALVTMKAGFARPLFVRTPVFCILLIPQSINLFVKVNDLMQLVGLGVCTPTFIIYCTSCKYAICLVTKSRSKACSGATLLCI